MHGEWILVVIKVVLKRSNVYIVTPREADVKLVSDDAIRCRDRTPSR